jgi:hypothetical protein
MCLFEQGRTTTSSLVEKSIKQIVQAPPALTIMSLSGFLVFGMNAPEFGGLEQQHTNINIPMQINGDNMSAKITIIKPIFLKNA